MREVGSEIGGDGGDRTRVRWLSTFRSTCLASAYCFNRGRPDGRGAFDDPKGFSASCGGRQHERDFANVCRPVSPRKKERRRKRVLGR